MAQKKFTGLSTEALNAALQSAKVKSALDARARRILPAAKATAYAAGAPAFAEALHIESGTRPGTGAKDGLQRPYARVIAELTPAIRSETRSAKLSRQRILRRGASNG